MVSVSDSSAGSSTTRRFKKFHLSVESFLPTEKGDRVLSCGEGEQLGHPGRNTTRKPRAIDTLPEDKLVRQVGIMYWHTKLTRFWNE